MSKIIFYEEGSQTTPAAGTKVLSVKTSGFYFQDDAGNELRLLTDTDLLVSINEQTDSYVLVLTDKDKLIRMNKATANNLTVPPNSSVAFPIGSQIIIDQMGAGQTTFVAGVGVTINSSGGKLKLTDQYSVARLIKVATDTWLLFDNIAA